MFVSHLECTECSSRADPYCLSGLCTECGAPRQVIYDLVEIRKIVERATLSGRPPGLWRFREVLPLRDPTQAVSLGEGDTPLLPTPQLGKEFGIDRLYVKDEWLNPTGSFKARGMTVAVSMAKSFGVHTLAAPSAGNAGGALAAYGARARLPVVLAMPRDVPHSNRLEASAYGARVEYIEGTIADCGRWIAAQCELHGWFNLSTLKEPYRVEGKKIMGYELAEQLGWGLPDVILYPTGGGTGLVGMAKAFQEMRALGWLNEDAPRPRLIAVQASGCAPVVEAYHAGSKRTKAPARPSTVASGLRVPQLVGDRWVLRSIRDSKGTAIAVSDEELLQGSLDLAKSEGIFPSPEAGALVAALRKLRASGEVAQKDSTVLFNTGTALKYPELFR